MDRAQSQTSTIATSHATAEAFPVATVRLIVCDSHGRVLIVRRQQAQYAPGQWCLPGGKVEYGETVDHAVTKELREETALECTSARFLFYQDSLPLELGKMHCINLYFACEVTGKLVLNEESSECAWIGPEELTRYRLAFRNDEGLRRYWKAASA